MFKKLFSTVKCWFASSNQEVPVIYRHGDINHDGKVDISDVTKLINMILGSEDPNSMADVNGDGKVDQSDVTRLLEIINTDNGDDDNSCIKKVLIDYFQKYKEQEDCGIKTFYGIPTDDILAWLEKRGEQKPVDKVEPRFKVKYAGSEYNVLEVKDIAGVTFYGIEDEPNHIDYVKAENCEIISGYAIKENGSPYPTKPAVFLEKKPTAWLEKQDKHLKNYDEAEKEKTDFVSGQFIECRKSFNEFKEDNSYWFEYVGDDIYIGRSDNILNQKFHITPRQLYRLFSQQHSPKEDSNVNDEANAPTEYGKYVDECLNEASKHFFSNGEDKYSVADLFYAGVRCGRLEKQGEQTNKINLQKITFEDVLALECAMKTVKITKGGNKLYEMLVLLYNKIHNAYLVEKQGEQKSQGKLALEAANEEKVDNQNCVKPAYKVESKFKAGDWIVWQGKYFKVNYNGCGYELTDQNGKSTSLEYGAIDETANLWTIQDAKAGDVLYSPKGAGVECIFLIEDWKQLECTGKTLCSSIVYRVEDDEIVVCEHGAIWWEGVVDLFYPATKEQRDLLFEKMKQEGYEWNAEKKELSGQILKITPKFCVGQLITDNNGTWYKITNIKCLDDWYYVVYDVCEDTTHHELCSIIDEKFRENRFAGEIKKMLEY